MIMIKMISVINTAGCYIIKFVRVNYKSSYHKEKIFFLSSFFRAESMACSISQARG